MLSILYPVFRNINNCNSNCYELRKSLLVIFFFLIVSKYKIWKIFRPLILIYSIVTLGIIISYEFFFLFLYYDYIHITPIVVDIYLIWKRRETLSRKFALYIIPVNISWLFSVYFLKLAYYNAVLLLYFQNFLIYLALWILLSFLFNSKSRDQIIK